MELNRTEHLHRMKLLNELRKIIGYNPPLDGILIPAKNKVIVDVMALDDLMDKNIPEYNADNCTYKGKKNYSCSMVVSEHYGERALEIVKELMK